MKYLGSKNRLAQYLLPFILRDRIAGQWYVEPFVGGCNMIDKIKGLRKGGDINRFLIAMLSELQAGTTFPDEISKSLYDDVRRSYRAGNGKYTDAIIGWVGFMASVNGRFFDGGYSGVIVTKIGTTRDYIAESIANIQKQVDALQGVEFRCASFEKLDIPPRSIIYCDPPYKGKKGYHVEAFDYERFWAWCRSMKEAGHQIFVSEETAPNDFTCLWEQKQSATVNPTLTKVRTERLFTL